MVLDAATGAKLEVEVPEQPMDPKLPASHEANRPIVNFISEAELPPELRDLYGKFIVCRLRIRRAQWLSAVGGTPNQWKVMRVGGRRGRGGGDICDACLNCGILK